MGESLTEGISTTATGFFLTCRLNFRLQIYIGDVRGLRADDPADDGDRDECVYLIRFILPEYMDPILGVWAAACGKILTGDHLRLDDLIASHFSNGQ